MQPKSLKMKKTISTLFALFLFTALLAQSDQYKVAMKGMLKKMNDAQTAEAYQAVANGFERIGTAERTEWLPKYYAAFSYIMQSMGTQDMAKVDPLLDQAEKLLAEAAVINMNDEILCLQSLCKSSRIKVDPMTRGMKYGPEASQLLEKAQALNPNNPRIYYLLGQSKFYTPEMFGGGKPKAKVLFEKAVATFSTYKPSGEFMPDWGAEQATKMLEEASK